METFKRNGDEPELSVSPSKAVNIVACLPGLNSSCHTKSVVTVALSWVLMSVVKLKVARAEFVRRQLIMKRVELEW